MKFVDTLPHNRRALGFVSFVVFFRSCASHAVVSSHTVTADTTLTNLSPIVTFCDTSTAGGNLEITLPDCTTLAENTDNKNQRFYTIVNEAGSGGTNICTVKTTGTQDIYNNDASTRTTLNLRPGASITLVTDLTSWFQSSGTYQDSTFIFSGLTVDGGATIIGGGLYVDVGGITVDDGTRLKSNLEVDGNTNTNQITSNGVANLANMNTAAATMTTGTVNTNLDVTTKTNTGSIEVTGVSTFEGASTFEAAVTVTSTLSTDNEITGASGKINTNLGVTTKTNTGEIEANSGNVNTNFGVGTLTVNSGNVNTNFGVGTLTANTGTVNTNLGVTTKTNTGSIQVNGGSTLTGAVTVTSTLSTDNEISGTNGKFNTNLNVGAAFNTGNINVNSGLSVGGDLNTANIGANYLSVRNFAVNNGGNADLNGGSFNIGNNANFNWRGWYMYFESYYFRATTNAQRRLTAENSEEGTDGPSRRLKEHLDANEISRRLADVFEKRLSPRPNRETIYGVEEGQGGCFMLKSDAKDGTMNPECTAHEVRTHIAEIIPLMLETLVEIVENKHDEQSSDIEREISKVLKSKQEGEVDLVNAIKRIESRQQALLKAVRDLDDAVRATNENTGIREQTKKLLEEVFSTAQ